MRQNIIHALRAEYGRTISNLLPMGLMYMWPFSYCTDTCLPVGVRAEVTADNESIRVSWKWSHQGVSMCVDFIRVDYQPEGGSLMMYTVGNTTATSANLPNLQCNTEYTIWVYARSDQIDSRSTPRVVSLQPRGMYIH